MTMPVLGDRIVGRYRVLSVLGQGGSATVYRALDENSDRHVALKVLSPGERGYSSDMLSRFEREVRAIARLRDPHTVTLHDSGRTEDGLLFMVFEFIEGRDLEEVIFEGERLSEEVVVHILWQLLQSIREAHAHGLLHRDIKPVNIRVYEYMGDPYHAKLIDFGIAREAQPEDRRITREGAMVGTPQFMAPEQIRAAPLTPATDIYGLGLVAVEMLTGRAAVDGKSSREILMRHLQPDRELLPRDARVSPALRSIVEKMVSYDAASRYQSAQEALDALEGLPPRPLPVVSPRLESSPRATTAVPTLTEAPPPLREATTEERGPSLREERRRRRDIAAVAAQGIGAAGLAMVLVIVVLSLFGSDEKEAVPPPPATLERPVVAEMPPEAPSSEPEIEAVEEEDSVTSGQRAVTEASAMVDIGQEKAAHEVGVPSGDGCGKEHPRHNGIRLEPPDRMFVVETYEKYDPHYRHPLILFLHDAKHSNGEQMDFPRETGLLPMADEEQFLTLAVKSLDDTPISAWSRFTVEVDFIQKALRVAREQYCIDETRIYAVSQGQGGGFMELARCELPLRAMVSSGWRNTKGDQACADGRVIPYLHIVGELDPWNPLAGGANCVGERRIPLEEKEKLWRSINGCSAREISYDRGEHHECRTWKGCDEPLVTCVHDAGDSWPEGNPHVAVPLLGSVKILSKCTSAYPRARFPMAEFVWRFFQKHSGPK